MRMKSYLLILAFILFLPLAAASEEKPDLDQVLAKYYQAIGGKERWNNLNTMIMTGSISSQERTLPLIAYYEKPFKCRVEFQVEDKVMAQVYGGYFGWQINPLSGNPDPAPMSRGRTNYLKNTCGIESSLIDYKKKGYKVKLLGEEDIKGKKAYKISVKYPSGNLETYYIDKETSLITRSVGLYNMDGAEVRTTTTFQDYKDTDGFVVPYNLIIKIHGAPANEILKINKFAFNPEIDTTIFDFPKDKMINIQNKEEMQKFIEKRGQKKPN